jgi:hypothetical protein
MFFGADEIGLRNSRQLLTVDVGFVNATDIALS